MSFKPSELYEEGLKNGLKPNLYKFGRGIPLSFDNMGELFLNSSKGYHYPKQRKYLKLHKFPKLASILNRLRDMDPKLREFGGRIFVAKGCIFTRYGDDYVPIYGNLRLF